MQLIDVCRSLVSFYIVYEVVMVMHWSAVLENTAQKETIFIHSFAAVRFIRCVACPS